MHPYIPVVRLHLQLFKKVVALYIPSSQFLAIFDGQVPHPDWLACQFSPNNETKKVSERFFGCLNVVRKLLKQQAKVDHKHAPWKTKDHKYIKEKVVKSRSILDQAVEDRSKVIWYPFGGIEVVGSIPNARGVPIAAVSRISLIALVPAGCIVEVKDHDWHVATSFLLSHIT
eukprot:685298-Ditylum_brightwellii.AAC.1